MTKDALDAIVSSLEDMHSNAARYLHTRTELSDAALIARLSYLMGEMKAPLKALRAHVTPEASED